MADPCADSMARSTVLRTAGAEVIAIEMSLRQRVLSAIAHPNIAYLLLSLGMLGLTVELWSPGADCCQAWWERFRCCWPSSRCQLLPVNYAGLLLIVLGMVLLILEIKVTSYGVLTIGGAASLIFGSMILVDSSAPELQLNLRSDPAGRRRYCRHRGPAGAAGRVGTAPPPDDRRGRHDRRLPAWR